MHHNLIKSIYVAKLCSYKFDFKINVDDYVKKISATQVENLIKL